MQVETLFKYIEPAILMQLGFQALKFLLVIVVAFSVLRVAKTVIQTVGTRLQAHTKSIGEQRRIDTLMRVFS